MYDEYKLIRAAKVLNTTPWELEDIDYKWIEWAFITERVESLIQAHFKKHPGDYDD